MFYRESGNLNKAEAILHDQIKGSPGNPILLNSLGVLLLKREQKKEALVLFSEAFDLLRRTAGIRHGSLYLDPAVNLAGQLIASRNHAKAYAILQTAWDWIDARPDSRTPNWQSIPSADGWYCEFGWMFLYAGDFVRAADYLAKTLSKKGSDMTASYWLAESAWLGNRLREHADFLIRSLVGFVASEPGAALCGCLAAQFSNKELSREMMAAISASIVGEKFQPLKGRPDSAVICSFSPEPLLARSLSFVRWTA